MRPTRVIGGRYVVLAELDRADAGAVWRAEDRVTGRQVAVEELRRPVGLGPEERRLFRERLLREARAAGRLEHPAIVAVHDVLSDGDVDHVVTELVEARPLADVVAASGPLDECAATELGRQLLGALRVAHDAGMVHGDVTPATVRVAPGRVLLTGFGVARAASPDGPPGHLAPERLAGGPVTAEGDLWGLGTTLFHAVAGHGPFDRTTAAATAEAVRGAAAPPTRTRGPLGPVISTLLQRDPQARLTAAQAGALLDVGPPEPQTPPTAGRRVAAALAVGLLLGLAVGAAAGAVLATPGPPEAAVLTYGDGGDVAEPRAPSCTDTVPAPSAAPAVVPCDGPHRAEIVAVTGPETGPARPDPAALGEYGRAACALRVEPAAAAEGLVVTVLIPAENGAGRAVYCVLTAEDGAELTGARVAGPG